MNKQDTQHIVTDIQAQVKHVNRYSIFIDGKFWCGLSADALLESKLSRGDNLSSKEAQQLKRTAEVDMITGRLLQWLAIRRRSEWEVVQYLQRKKIPKDLQHSLLGQFKDRQLIDDLAFAKSWVANRRLLKSISRKKLEYELRQKRVSNDIIDDVLRQDEADESTVLKDLILTKRQQSRYQDEKKLMQYLARQGFRYGDIKTALEELSSQ